MAAQRASRPTGTRTSTTRALHLVLRLLAILVFAQALFAGQFLDGNAAWRDWHAINGTLVLPLLALVAVALAILVWRADHGPGWLPLASTGLLLAIVVQIGMGMTSRLAVHVPLGVAILGAVGALLGRTRNLTRAAASPAGPGQGPR